MKLYDSENPGKYERLVRSLTGQMERWTKR